ncbi:hypothetical protein RGU12_19580 [Fredinandcohnia sp. QZ13]|uniref:hypothetical protein n=1 Tax=Fredinandcohnia sp. QZ13 TaxID=3073144 RepID=UPI0028532CE2|nr:hypothetical protein [Fredinandcohnia sp. QZ13]MDR4889699.1 hypothetical protein [Fredinandcohnia sp. QZ13]
MFYDSFSTVIYMLLIWWGVFLVFQRINNRYPKSNPWKKDIILTFIQSLVVTLLIPFIVMLVRLS